jgi:hypothetical protein
MSDSKRTLSLLFKRPLDPVFVPRDKQQIDVPESFLTDRYKDAVPDLQSRFGENEVDLKIPVRNVAFPDLSFTNDIKITGGFSLFLEKHRDIAGRLVELFVTQPTLEAFVSVAAYAKDRLNAYLYQYALSVAISHRPDTRDVEVPSIVHLFPDRFVDPKVFPRIREEATLVQPANRRPIDIPINYTAGDRELEQRLAYFREDIGVNAHHWHWHLVYPGSGLDAIVRKDRRGELFYYMHAQVIARYNVERLANNLARVARFGNNFRELIPEGYFPKIVRSSNNYAYPPRVSNAVLRDLDRNEVTAEIADLERWRDRIYEAIDQRFIIRSNGERVPLGEQNGVDRGIDILGDLVEASSLTPNRDLYGSLHNTGHDMLAFCHDPDGRHLEEFGVMGDVTTAMRDPIFYRFHSFIDSVFIRYKLTLPEYNNQQLGFDGVQIQSIQAQLTRPNAPANVLLTYWQRSQVDLAAGLDFGPDGNVFAQFTHLQHAPFQWRFTVNNGGAARRGTCRIFIGPRTDERGTALNYRDQRLLMIEMDKFTVNLNSGMNTIVRRSDESNVTIPFERTFRQVGRQNQPTDPTQLAQFQFCGCGWPQHMLLPKGKVEGMPFDIFVMISNFADDTTNQDYNERESCNDAASFCGLRDRLYPDRRPMGFPFDRNNAATSLTQFANKTTNMALGQLQIRFSNTYVNKN